MLRASCLIHISKNENFAQFTFNYVNLCDNTHHLNPIFITGPQETTVVLEGDMVPAGTMLVTPVLAYLPGELWRCKVALNSSQSGIS